MQWFDQFLHHYITAGGNSERGVLQKSASVSPGWMMVTTGRMTAFVAVQSFFLRLHIPGETILLIHRLLSCIIDQISVCII